MIQFIKFCPKFENSRKKAHKDEEVNKITENSYTLDSEECPCIKS